MGNVVDVIDCRGFRVICTDEIWYGKILVSRPWMKGWERLVRDTIAAPSFICEDADYKKRQAYYLMQVDRCKYIKVVAKFNGDNRGFVISAYPADSGKQKETIIWMP